ncbi:MAG: hypothetical protein IJD80_07140 [Oscillospiraceae bacterium]|nr:hypothetical protein [Oscillospiraceae bacterium]
MKTAMKKLITFVLSAAMVISLTACGTESGNSGGEQPEKQPSDKPDAVAEIRENIAEDETMAVVYLGCFTDDIENVRDYIESLDLDDRFGFIKDIPQEHIVNANGYELYCIIPKEAYCEISVGEWYIDEGNDWQGEETGIYYYGENDDSPLLVLCNYSDIMPNAVITVRDDADFISRFVPYISLKDGSLVSWLDDEKPVRDLTPYEKIGPSDFERPGGDYTEEDIYTDEGISGDGSYTENVFEVSMLKGDWSTTATSTNGTALEGVFSFNGEGYMFYSYGNAGQPHSTYYEGNYEVLDNNTIKFEIWMTDYSDFYPAEVIRSVMRFEKAPDSDELTMILVEGDLIFGVEQDTTYQLTYAYG